MINLLKLFFTLKTISMAVFCFYFKHAMNDYGTVILICVTICYYMRTQGLGKLTVSPREIHRAKLPVGENFPPVKIIGEKLDLIQSSAIKLALGALCSSLILSLAAESVEPPLQYRFLTLTPNFLVSTA